MADAELPPAIADCLGTSVDALSGRTIDNSGIEAALMKKQRRGVSRCFPGHFI